MPASAPKPSDHDFPTGPIAVDRRAARAAMGVVPIEVSPEPASGADPVDTRVTREIAPVPRASARDTLRDLDVVEAPVFQALLRESQIAEAMAPAGLEPSRPPPVDTVDDDHKPTVVGLARFEPEAEPTLRDPPTRSRD